MDGFVSRAGGRLPTPASTAETENLHFSVSAGILGGGLDEQLAEFLREHPDTMLVIIDTMQKIREHDRHGRNGDDYRLREESYDGIYYIEGARTMNHFEIKYEEADDGMLDPMLEYSKQPAGDIGKYGGMRLQYLQRHLKTAYGMMRLEGTLKQHLLDVNDQALKKLYDLSDERLIASAQTNMAYKYFLGLEAEEGLIDPSLLTKFRETRITKDILEDMLKETIHQAIAKGLVRSQCCFSIADSFGLPPYLNDIALKTAAFSVTFKYGLFVH